MKADIPLRQSREMLERLWKRKDFLYWIGLIALLMASFWLRLERLDSYRLTYDEGIFLMFARFIAAGYQPYSEVFVSYLPPFPFMLALAWRVFGSVTAVRLTIVALALVSLVALGLIARHLAGRLAGLASVLFLSFQPEFFRQSRTIIADVPATSFATIAIGFAWWYSESGHRRWLVVSILALVLSLMLLDNGLAARSDVDSGPHAH
jgi:4-amino-4-deoxy-L-arabinose transferase-like glycosyltransferase